METEFKSINPFTEELMASFPSIGKLDLESKINAMKLAQQSWRNTPLKDRLYFLPKLSELLKIEADALAQIASEEMGKVKSHAKAEVIKSATLCDYYFGQAEQILASRKQDLGNNLEVDLQYEPLGIVLGIFPWNFPYWQILRSAIPTIISGNAMLVKPAPNVPQSSLALQKIINQCGLPQELFVTAFIETATIESTIANPKIAAVTLTGSGKAGAIVASQAAKNIKPAVLELGGNDPLILLEDAPLDQILDEILFSRFQNNGQSCVAAKRFLVHQNKIKEFTNKAIEKIKNYKVGNPQQEGIEIGPLARLDLKTKLAEQVKKSVAQGAEILFQHQDFPEKGFFFPPTILYNISPENIASREELFGPVLSLYSYSGEEELIQIANQTPFGLGASIFSKDLVRAKRIASQIEAGMVYINQMVKSDVRVPFGGIKNSGFGRELGPEGLMAFCQRKTVWVK